VKRAQFRKMTTRKKRRSRPRRYLLMTLAEYKARVTEAALLGQRDYFSSLVENVFWLLRVALNMFHRSSLSRIGNYKETLKFGSLKIVLGREAGSGLREDSFVRIYQGKRRLEHVQHLEDVMLAVRRVAKSEPTRLQFLDLVEHRRRAVLRRAIGKKWWKE